MASIYVPKVYSKLSKRARITFCDESETTHSYLLWRYLLTLLDCGLMNRNILALVSRHMCRYIAIQPHVVSSKVSRYLGRDTIRVSRSHVSRCIDASMHRYTPNYAYSIDNSISIMCYKKFSSCNEQENGFLIILSYSKLCF